MTNERETFAARRHPPIAPSSVSPGATWQAATVPSLELDVLAPRASEAASIGPSSISPVIRFLEPGEEPRSDAWVYAPDRATGVLDAHSLRNALLAIAHQRLDFLVVSHTLADPPVLRLVSARNAMLFSAAAWHALQTTSRLPEGARGRVIRLLPAPTDAGPLVEIRPAELGVGELHCDGGELVAPGTRRAEPVAAPASRLFEPPRSLRPCVLVLPTMLAVGGVERNLIEVARQLRDRFEFVVVTTERLMTSRGSLSAEMGEQSTALFELGELGPQSTFLDMLATIHREYDPKLVWICNGSPWLLANSKALRTVFRDVPIVDQQVYDTKAGWIEHYADEGIQSFDRFIAINRQIRRVFLDRLGISPDRVDLIYHAVNTERFHPERAESCDRARVARELDLALDQPLFAMVGRLTEQKRPLDFLDLARRAAEAGIAARFLLVGDGDLSAECDAFIARHGLSNVHRVPYCDDMSRIFPLLSGLIVCSAYEGLPIAMLEALAMGVPVLSTPVGDVPLVLEEYRCGHVVEGTPDGIGWLAAFRSFLEDLPGLRARATAASGHVAKRFSAQAAAATYQASWERAMDGFSPDERSSAASAARRERVSSLPSISVVIPTYNRGELLERTLRRSQAYAGPVDLEFVVIDDGSRDDTATRLEALERELPNLRWRSVPNGGPGQARNLGAALAKHDVVLFMGDDIQPKDERFFATHAELHARHPERSLAVLGKIVWPNRPRGEVNFIMAHIQGPHGEQFGYADLHPYSFLDWRFFYTANVSVKRGIVDDWMSEGFSDAFTQAAYEDAEFAWRMMRSPDPLRIFYTPASVGTHHHQYSASSFLERQTTAGLMARIFVDLHPDPEVRHLIGLVGVMHALETPLDAVGSRNAADFLSVIEGLKSWVRLVDQHQDFGSQAWHDELLGAIFRLCYLQGFVTASSGPTANTAAAYYLILDEFVRSIQRVIHVELSGRVLDGRGVESLFSMVPLGGPPAPVSWLRAWAKRQPVLVRLWHRVRHRVRGL